MAYVFRATDLRLEQTVAVKALTIEAASHESLVLRFEREAQRCGSSRTTRTWSACSTRRSTRPSRRRTSCSSTSRGATSADDRRGRSPSSAGGRRPLPASLLCSRRRPRSRHHPPRRQAEQPVLDDRSRGPTARQGARLRHCPDALGPVSHLRTGTGSFPRLAPVPAPEHLQGAGKADERSDIWSLGTALYQMLTGHLPFSGSTRDEVGESISRRPPPPSQLRSDILVGLDDVVMGCLKEDPDKRMGDVSALAHALLPFTTPSMKYLVEKHRPLSPGHTGGRGGGRRRPRAGGTARRAAGPPPRMRRTAWRPVRASGSRDRGASPGDDGRRGGGAPSSPLQKVEDGTGPGRARHHGGGRLRRPVLPFERQPAPVTTTAASVLATAPSALPQPPSPAPLTASVPSVDPTTSAASSHPPTPPPRIPPTSSPTSSPVPAKGSGPAIGRPTAPPATGTAAVSTPASATPTVTLPYRPDP